MRSQPEVCRPKSGHHYLTLRGCVRQVMEALSRGTAAIKGAFGDVTIDKVDQVVADCQEVGSTPRLRGRVGWCLCLPAWVCTVYAPYVMLIFSARPRDQGFSVCICNMCS